MPIRFRQMLMYDALPMLSLEDIYMSAASLSGVHAFEFDDYISSDFTDAAGWSDAEGVWTLGTGSGSGFDYAPLWSTTPMPASCKITADLMTVGTFDGPCIIFRGTNSTTYYVARLSSGAVGFYRVTSGVVAPLSVIPTVTELTGPGYVELGVNEVQYSEDEQDRFLFMTLLFNGQHLLTAHDHIPSGAPGLAWGMGVAGGKVAEWRSVRIPDLYDIVPWSSTDPDETAMSAINRAVGDRVIAQFVRFNGKLRAWRPKATPVAYTFTRAHQTQFVRESDTLELVSHVRLQYASGWVDVFSPELYAAFGHRFKEFNNSDIYSREEAYAEAQAILRRSLENARKCTFAAINRNLFLEPEDHIELPNGEEYLVDQTSFAIGTSIQFSLKGRRYAF